MFERIKHFGALDFYRFLAASGVFALHFSQYAKYDYHFGFGKAVNDFALFVDFFFILSGFVIGLNYSDAVNTPTDILYFLRKRIARIYPLHILTLILLFLPTLLGHSDNADKWNVISVAKELALVQSWPLHAPLPYNFVSWSISVEWAMYLLFPAIIFFYRRLGPAVLVALIICGFATIEWLLTTDQANPPLWFLLTSPIRAIPTFIVGILISQTFRDFKIRNGILMGFGAFCLGVICMVVHTTTAIPLLLFSLAVFLTSSGYVQSGCAIFDNRAALAFGNSSYSIYMLHALFLGAILDKLWTKLNLGNVPLIAGLILWLVLVGISILSFKYFESPTRQWMSPKKLSRDTYVLVP